MRLAKNSLQLSGPTSSTIFHSDGFSCKLRCIVLFPALQIEAISSFCRLFSFSASLLSFTVVIGLSLSGNTRIDDVTWQRRLELERVRDDGPLVL